MRIACFLIAAHCQRSQPFLHFPGVLLRTSTERPEALVKGTIVIGGIIGKDVEQASEIAVTMHESD